jgi:ring-1,2-phenylacetyl-CoA epoxidase subunit PaaE
MSETVEEILQKSNVNPNQVFKEAFYQSEELKDIKEFVEKQNIKTAKLKIIDFDIEFDNIECKPGQSILTASKLNDVDIPHSCLTGECKLCKCRLIEGEIIDKNKNIILSGNEILACLSYPLVENIKIEL